ncbi:adenylyltransferase/cytidyltransferase family protein [Gammaproteobacteria bacterium]|jgi:cytidyltransferase-like protein|nr:adenylyltransferase/cytidyltransferase family protein [Gammaproteobacteria bacterium]|tara:strand:+ start:179 stop:952 length:774 start_codon:yes stop_codon:yes gene_type:complete
MKIVLVTGGFDPIHSGHISYLKSAKALGDKLVVGLNSDAWLDKKKEKFFMPFTERKIIIENLSCVDQVISFEDDENGSAIGALEHVKKIYPEDTILFANGGDRNIENIPEMSVQGVKFLFGVGGDDKKNSSSWILKKWKYFQEERVWGSYYNLFKDNDVKVKELIVSPGQGMSFQRHKLRSEIWLVSKGCCVVNFSKDNPENRETITLKKFDKYLAKVGDWHQITNPFDQPCHLIEIQYGEEVSEEDIERLDFYTPQ